jgi:hypothetical protein
VGGAMTWPAELHNNGDCYPPSCVICQWEDDHEDDE